MLDVEQLEWTCTFNNTFAKNLHGTLPEHLPLNYPSTIRSCACCNVLVDSRFKLEYHTTRLSEVRVASESCALCEVIFRVASRSCNDAEANHELVRDGAALRLWQPRREGPRILRLCSDVEYPPLYRDDIPIGFPVLPEPGSSTYFALLRAWLQWCDTTHDCDQRDAGSQEVSPTRLIYVGRSDSGFLQLYVPRKDERVKYTALSHRWGKNPPSKTDPRFCTTNDNVNARLKGFSSLELPETFQDAVRVTRELDIEYLWIDSLCIIQWDLEDWKREASRMENVFASAYCVIAATSAADSNAGFLAQHRSTEYVRVQDATGKQVCVCAHMDDFKNDVEQAELNKRAWVMQERVLAKRTIHFSANQTYWECGKGVYCENLTIMKSLSQKNDFLLDPSFPDRLMGSDEQDAVGFIHSLFEDYSKRDLTKNTDRCVAASGLEARIANALRCNSRHGIFQKHLHRNLLWQASDGKTERIAYNNDRQVPSWSWMACSGGIKFMNIKVGSVSWANTLTFDDECDYALVTDVGEFQNCTIERQGDRYTVSSFFGEEKGWVRYDVESGEKGREEHCVVVGRTEKVNKGHYYILVVVPTSVYGEFRRVGVGMVRNDCIVRLRADVRIV